MKVLALLLLSLLALTTAKDMTAVTTLGLPDYESQDNGFTEAVEVVGGILIGAFSSHSSIKECFDNSKEIFEDFKNAYISLRQETYNGVEGGLVHIGRALLKMPDAIKTCKDMTKIVDKLKSLAVKFSNPTLLAVTVGKNIIWHSISIYREVNTAISTYNAKQWFSFGQAIGSIMDLVFLRMKRLEEMDNNSGTEFLQGLAHGISPSTYNDVSGCIKSCDTATFNKINELVKKISIKHPDSSVTAIRDLGKILVAAINNCKSGKSSVENLVKKLSEAFNAGTFVSAAIKIASNPLKFVKIVDAIHKDFDKKKYFAAGDEIGKFIGEVLKTRMPLNSFIAGQL